MGRPLALCLGVAISVLALAWSAAADPSNQAEGAPPLAALFGGPFTLTDHTGARRTDADFAGQFMLIYFGYTYCPDICPTNLEVMARALDRLGAAAEDVVPIFVTIDPGRDDASTLGAYLAHFGERFVGLSGSEAEIQAVARAYRVHRRKVIPDWVEGADDYLVDHASITYLMGPDGRFRTLFPHDTPDDVMAERIRAYLDAETL